jgi:hypothetical protein
MRQRTTRLIVTPRKSIGCGRRMNGFFVHYQHFFTFVYEEGSQLQQLNALAYLTAAIAAYRRRGAVASLLKRTQTP